VNEDTRAAGEQAMIQGDAGCMQGVTSGLFAALRLRHDAERSVRKVTAFLAEPQ